RDLGRDLGCFGHVAALRRTAVGPFSENDAITLEKLEELRHKDADRTALREVLLPVETALADIPALAVNGNQASRIVRGQQVILRGADAPLEEEAVLATWKGRPLAICTVEAGILRPKRVFNLG
ncbi:MAG TPA: tRNA pseudouridine(55) synthase TruB, partial [Thermopetrobacter sp.]|nr:tRNA pseudouridine(55) synthase TruB [Thermopetrobacter sp.]